MRVATLDLGSNTFLCLIVETNGSTSQVLFDEYRTVRLGQEVKVGGRFHPDALTRAEAALREFAEIIKKFSVDEVIVGATAAARKVADPTPLSHLVHSFGWKLKILSGDEEAQLTFSGAAMDHPKQNLGVIDIGGASTEVAFGKDHRIEWRKSFPLGGVSIFEKFFDQGIPSPTQIAEARRYIQNEMPKLEIESQDSTKNRIWLGVAGTPTEIARLISGTGFGSHLQGTKISISNLQSWIGKLESATVEERIQKLGVESGRADILYSSCLVLETFMIQQNISEILVSLRGLRYGLLQMGRQP